MQAYEYLNQVKQLDMLIDNKRAEEYQLWALATSITQTNDGMPHATGISDKVGNTVQKIIEIQEKTNALIDRYIDTREDVIKHIEMLPAKQYEVLHWLYIKKRKRLEYKNQKWYYTWSEVAENLGCSEQNIAKLRKKAVKNLQRILDSEQKQYGGNKDAENSNYG